MNSAGTETYYDKPDVIEALQYWVDLVEQVQGASGGHRRLGHDAEGFLREEGRDDVDDDRQPHQRARPTPSSTSAWRCCPRTSSAAARPAAATSTSSRRATPEQREAAFKFIKWMTTPERAAQWGIDTGYVAVRADAWETPAMKKYVADFPPAAVARDQLQYRGRRALDARQPARDQGAQRRPAGGAHRHQDARAGDEGRAARGRSAAAVVQVAERHRVDRTARA